LVVAGMRAVGLLLIAALLVVPVAAGSRIAHSFRGSMLVAMALGVVSSMVGLLIALWQGHIAPGGSIVLTALGFFGLSMAFGRRAFQDRKSTRLNSSHQINSYTVFCLKKINSNLQHIAGTDICSRNHGLKECSCMSD